MKRGSHHTKECKMKMSLARLGKPHGHKTSNGGGWKLSAETRRRMGKNGEGLKKYYKTSEGILRKKEIGLRNKLFFVGQGNPFFGKSHSGITRSGWSKKRTGLQLGELHPNWKGGVSRNKHTLSSPKYKYWRNEVFNRDNYKCQDCGLAGIYLEAHHIKSWSKYPDLRYNIDNGMTLCRECHKKTDNYKGKSNIKLYASITS